MKRSSSPTMFGISSSPIRGVSDSSSENKSQEEAGWVIESNPAVVSDDLYIIRKVKRGETSLSLVIQLDRGIDPNQVGILHAHLRHLNDLRERAPLGQRQPSLALTLKYDVGDNYLIHATAQKKEDMATFVNSLVKNEYLSSNTAINVLSMLDQPLQSIASYS